MAFDGAHPHWPSAWPPHVSLRPSREGGADPLFRQGWKSDLSAIAQSPLVDHKRDRVTLYISRYTDEPPPCLLVTGFFAMACSAGNPTATTVKPTVAEDTPLAIRKSF